MKPVFADTYFFIALLNPRDEHHAVAWIGTRQGQFFKPSHGPSLVVNESLS